MDFLYSAAPTISSVLVVAFTSYGDDDAPAEGFDFFETLEARSDCNRLYLRDVLQHWYLGGVAEFSTDLSTTASRIREFADYSNSTRIIMIGSSMGAFGAVAVGAYVPAHVVLAFGCNASVDVDFTNSIGDRRWLKRRLEIADLNLQGRDLRDLLHQHCPNRCDVYYDSEELLEAAHGTALSQCNGVTGIAISGAGHNVARYLLKTGRLTSILDEAIGAGPSGEVKT